MKRFYTMAEIKRMKQPDKTILIASMIFIISLGLFFAIALYIKSGSYAGVIAVMGFTIIALERRDYRC